MSVVFSPTAIGGRGALHLTVDAGAIPLATFDLPFTSPDLNASCVSDNGASNVVDLGIFAAGFPPGYNIYSDLNCSGLVNVVDLGIWASGLGKHCP